MATPVYDPVIREELRYYFNLQMRDPARARIIDEALSNTYRRGAGNHRAQVEIYRWLARAAQSRTAPAASASANA